MINLLTRVLDLIKTPYEAKKRNKIENREYKIMKINKIIEIIEKELDKFKVEFSNIWRLSYKYIKQYDKIQDLISSKYRYMIDSGEVIDLKKENIENDKVINYYFKLLEFNIKIQESIYNLLEIIDKIIEIDINLDPLNKYEDMVINKEKLFKSKYSIFRFIDKVKKEAIEFINSFNNINTIIIKSILFSQQNEYEKLEIFKKELKNLSVNLTSVEIKLNILTSYYYNLCRYLKYDKSRLIKGKKTKEYIDASDQLLNVLIDKKYLKEIYRE